MAKISKEYEDLLRDETRAFACLATTMEDGSPQVTPIWFNTDGEFILINSAVGRVKDRNMRARSRIALVILDPKDPYRYLQIRGRVVEITEQGARAHINQLSKKYTGNDQYQLRRPDEVRVTYRIRPESISS